MSDYIIVRNRVVKINDSHEISQCLKESFSSPEMQEAIRERNIKRMNDFLDLKNKIV